MKQLAPALGAFALVVAPHPTAAKTVIAPPPPPVEPSLAEPPYDPGAPALTPHPANPRYWFDCTADQARGHPPPLRPGRAGAEHRQYRVRR